MNESIISMSKRQVMAPGNPDSSAWPGKHIIEGAGVLQTRQSSLPSLPVQSVNSHIFLHPPIEDASGTLKRLGAQHGPIPSASDRRIQPYRAWEAMIPNPGDTLQLLSDRNGDRSTRTGVVDKIPQTMASTVVPDGLQLRLQLPGPDIDRSRVVQPGKHPRLQIQPSYTSGNGVVKQKHKAGYTSGNGVVKQKLKAGYKAKGRSYIGVVPGKEKTVLFAM